MLSHWPVTSGRTAFKSAVRYRPSNSRACSLFSVWPRKNTISRLRAGAQFDRCLQCRARIETRSYLAGKWAAPFQCRRTLKRSVAAQKFCAVPVKEVCSPARSAKAMRPAEFSAPHAFCEDRSCLRIDLRDDVRQPKRCVNFPAPIRHRQSPKDGATRPESFFRVSREIFIGSSGGTNCNNSSRIPCEP